MSLTTMRTCDTLVHGLLSYLLPPSSILWKLYKRYCFAGRVTKWVRSLSTSLPSTPNSDYHFIPEGGGCQE